MRLTELSEVRPSYPECPTLNIGTIRSPALHKILLRLEHDDKNRCKAALSAEVNSIHFITYVIGLIGGMRTNGKLYWYPSMEFKFMSNNSSNSLLRWYKLIGIKI